MHNNDNFSPDELFSDSSAQQNNTETSEQPIIYTTNSGQKIIRAKKSNLPDIQGEKNEKKSVAPVVLVTIFIIIVTIIILLLFYGKSEKAISDNSNNDNIGISTPVKEIPTLITTSENGELSVCSAETDVVEIHGNTYTYNGRTYTIQKDEEGNITGVINSEGEDVSVKNENGIIEYIKDEDGMTYKVNIMENNTEGTDNGDNEVSSSAINIDYTKKVDDVNISLTESGNGNPESTIGIPHIDMPVTDTTSVNVPELVDTPTIEVPPIETPGIIGTPSVVSPQIEISTMYIPAN